MNSKEMYNTMEYRHCNSNSDLYSTVEAPIVLLHILVEFVHHYKIDTIKLTKMEKSKNTFFQFLEFLEFLEFLDKVPLIVSLFCCINK